MLTPYNYTSPGKSVGQTSGGSLKPYSYATYIAPPAVTPEPSLIEKSISAVKNYAQASANTVPTLGQHVIDTISNPLKAVVDFGNFMSAPAKEGIRKIAQANSDFDANKGIANKTAAAADFISGFASTAFSPITGVFNVADQIPGAKQVADTLNIPFAVLGTAGSWSTGKVIDYLPIPEESKAIIKQPLQELGALAAQVAFGGKIMDRIGVLSKKGTEITPEVAKALVKEVKTETAPTETKGSLTPYDYSKTPAEAHADYAKSQGYEPYTPPNELPTIEAGSGAKSNLPTTQAEAKPSTKLGDLTVEPIKSPYQAEVATKETLAAKTETATPVSEVKSVEVPQRETPSGTIESKIGKSIEAKAVEDNLTSGFDKTALHESTSFAEQAKLGADVVNKGKDEINAIINGEKPLPEKLHPAGFIAAAEAYLKKNPNVEMQYRLANSRIVSETSRQASGLSIARMRTPDSATAKLQEIRKAKEARAGETAVKSAKSFPARAKKVMNEVNLSEADLGKIDSFIDKITC